MHTLRALDPREVNPLWVTPIDVAAQDSTLWSLRQVGSSAPRFIMRRVASGLVDRQQTRYRRKPVGRTTIEGLKVLIGSACDCAPGQAWSADFGAAAGIVPMYWPQDTSRRCGHGGRARAGRLHLGLPAFGQSPQIGDAGPSVQIGLRPRFLRSEASHVLFEHLGPGHGVARACAWPGA